MPVSDANEPSEDPLEPLIDRALREQPLLRAPPTLESRVLAELERRTALPWWRRSFAHWPLGARAAFILLCSASAALAIAGGATAAAGIRSLSWAREIGALIASGGSLVSLLASIALPPWLYASVAVCALLYAALFGLGAALYRTLYLQPLNGK